MKTFIMIAASTCMIAVGASAADARARGGHFSVQGSGGRGLNVSRSINRQPGSVAATRSIQTNGGHGVTTTRGGSWSNGVYSGGATHTTNNGTTWGRSTSATANPNGGGSFNSTVTGPAGGHATVSGSTGQQ
ncbi:MULTISPECIES: hypothetical protein [unclassified Novosphingobium]|uniref:hypothetical protein n=1 Tax=unclassified Novosphingobium TaxID=2644732 RepID=UPI0008692296|nr:MULTISPECIES: hypothetical protein [unclassified Novosphingobium]MBN9146407.1 hypothetical protein [Novosphingobium sp.]MDR6708349.1 hypothetical protein [Novosphingobium sp. 1748]ODU80163.1 MAG: hypothetical protein ABT10_18665 [Novosphingobium sp. SCN 63-17]OJX94895.1 MAG: hypothetical protein BGP00_08255 [Novosphingobium sp. 63-713]